MPASMVMLPTMIVPAPRHQLFRRSPMSPSTATTGQRVVHRNPPRRGSMRIGPARTLPWAVIASLLILGCGDDGGDAPAFDAQPLRGWRLLTGLPRVFGEANPRGQLLPDGRVVLIGGNSAELFYVDPSALRSSYIHDDRSRRFCAWRGRISGPLVLTRHVRAEFVNSILLGVYAHLDDSSCSRSRVRECPGGYTDSGSVRPP